MSRLILDAGALVGWDRGAHEVALHLEAASRAGMDLVTTGVVVAQAWRDGSRQARLARLLRATDVVPVDDVTGRRVGELLGRSGTADPADGSVVAVARPGDRVLTSDVTDIGRLGQASGRRLTVVRC